MKLVMNPTTGKLDLVSETGDFAPNDATFITLSTNATLPNERVLAGTTNQVIITDQGAGLGVVLSLPQNIHTAATPTFAGLTLGSLTGFLKGATGVVSAQATIDISSDTNLAVTAPLVLTGDTLSITGSALTKTDDINVTLTLGGTPATALLAAMSLTLGWTGILSELRGGTGVSALSNITAASTKAVITGGTGAVIGGNVTVDIDPNEVDLTDLGDVNTSGQTKNYALLFNGTTWVAAPQGTSFTFSISSFTDNQSSPQLMGTAGTLWKAAGALSYTASYSNGPATSGSVQIISGHSAWTSPLDMGAGTSYQGPTTNTEVVNYPASVGTTITWRLTASDGVDSPTSTVSVAFYNLRFWGVSTTASGYTEANVEGLANNELSNSRAKTFTVTAGASEYIIYAYPTRLGTATFTVGGFEGGFESPETVSVTNTAGFTENYYVYRSTNPNLGSTTVVVT